MPPEYWHGECKYQSYLGTDQHQWNDGKLRFYAPALHFLMDRKAFRKRWFFEITPDINLQAIEDALQRIKA